ncbi:hypothetical protein ACFQX7_00815 [Luedemannella flava]
MPDEDDPSYARWSAAIRRELAPLDDGAVVVGHSVGATILVNALGEQPPEQRRAFGRVRVAVDLGARLPRSVAVHVFHELWRSLVRLRLIRRQVPAPVGMVAPTG